MKMNLFVINGREESNHCGLHEFRGHRAVGNYDPEDEVVEDIDNQKKAPEKILAQSFLKFLEGQRLTIASLKLLSEPEQRRLKKEFLNKLD